MSRLTRDATAEPVLRDQVLRHERGQGNIHFSCLADHVQDWQPYPVDPYSCYMCDHTWVWKGLKVFPAGVGLNSPSRVTHQLAVYAIRHRPVRSVETWRGFGCWLRILREELGHARGRWQCRGKPGSEPQHAQAYRGTLYWARKHQIWLGRRSA